MLSAELVDQFWREGFCAVSEFLSIEETESLLEGIRSASAGATLAHHAASRLEMDPNQAPDADRVRRMYEPCTHYPEFRKLSEHDKLLDSVAQLLGENLL